MRKLLLLLFFLAPAVGFAEGPKIPRHKDPAIQLEFENAYQDIRSNRLILSSFTASSLTVCIDSPTFCVDLANNRVGISTAGPVNTLTVVGTGRVTDNFLVSGGDVGIGTVNPNVGGFGADASVIELKGQSADNGGIVQLVAPDLTGSASAGTIAFYNLDGGASVVSRSFILGYRDAADDAMGLRFQTEATGGSQTTALEINSSGANTRPLQPSFLTHLAPTTLSNVTGDGTVVSPVAWSSEIYDQSSSLSGSTFTAPVAGKYKFTCFLYLGDLSASHTRGSLTLVTSNRTYTIVEANLGAMRTDTNRLRIGGTVGEVDMDADDIAYISMFVTNGALTVDIRANADDTALQSFFSGSLLH